MRLSSVQNAFFLGAILAITICFFWIIHIFLMPLFWAVLFSILFFPLNERYCKIFKGRRTIASGLTLLTFVVLVLIPFILLSISFMNEAFTMYDRINSGEIDVQKAVYYMEQYIPVITEHLDKFGIDTQKIKQWMSSSAVTASQFVVSKLMLIGQNVVNFAIMTVLMLYVLFFFLRDGNTLIAKLIRMIPMGDRREKFFFQRFATVSRATVKGTFIIALVQGGLGGIIFYFLGINAAIFWGALMTLASIFPAVGSSIIWGPAAIILFATGQIAEGIILLVLGSIIIGAADNLLRPILVGQDTELPDYLVLLSTLGGLALLGISGFIVGPVTAALFISAWEMFGEEFGYEEDFEDFSQSENNNG